MTPKRKRTDVADPQAETSTRATRASARNKKPAIDQSASSTKTANATKSPATKASTKTSSVQEPEQVKPSKKTKTATTNAKNTKKTVTKGSKATVKEDGSGPSKVTTKPAATKTQTETEQLKSASFTATTTTPSAKPPNKSYEVYNANRALAIFKKYADPDDPDVIGPEGFTQLCTDAQMPMDGALPLVLAWQLQAKEMGKLTKKEWVQGMSLLQISALPQLSLAVKDLENLLILGGQPLKRSTSSSPTKKKGEIEPYDRTTYWTYAADRKAGFLKLYVFCFALAKPEQARNIDMETATAFWSVLLAPQYPIMGEVIEFINEKGTYKGSNKDLWSMMFEFCQSVKPSLEDYEADGAWPTLLDDFALWKRSKMSNGQVDSPVGDPDD